MSLVPVDLGGCDLAGIQFYDRYTLSFLPIAIAKALSQFADFSKAMSALSVGPLLPQALERSGVLCETTGW